MVPVLNENELSVIFVCFGLTGLKSYFQYFYLRLDLTK